MIPDEFIRVVREVVKLHPDPKSAVNDAEQRLRQLPIFQQYVADLVTAGVAELVYRERGMHNRELRTQAGQYGGPAKVRVGASELVNRAYQSYFNYFIGASRLGLIKGEQLIPLAQQERGLSEGHLFNAKLLEALRPLVPDGREVEAVVSDRKLKRLFETLRQPRRTRRRVG